MDRMTQRYVNGVLEDFTEEEELAHTAAKAAFEPKRAGIVWQKEIAATDNAVSRQLEDIFDVMSEEQQAAVAQQTKDLIAAKKTLRSEKPE
jgi:hypothetical protein